jgi:spermidine synthase
VELWFTEKQTENLGLSLKVTKTLHVEQTDYQHLAVLDTKQYGRMLALDGIVQTTVADEFVYHEMITHVPLITHPNPKRVAVIGGGDGGAIREILKHPSVEEAVLVEIDGRVIEASRQYLPEISCGLSDPRVRILVADGIAHIREKENYYDVIIIDSTDPIGAAVGLFSSEFYASVFKALTDDGIMVAQTESPFANQEIVRKSFAGISQNFPIAELYLAVVPTYPGGLWSFTMGSKKVHPLEADLTRANGLETRYYNADIHTAAFKLPNFVRKLLETK